MLATGRPWTGNVMLLRYRYLDRQLAAVCLIGVGTNR